MARISGQTQLPTNVDVLFNAPFDARTWTESYSGLTDGTIPQPYLGMLVSVYNDQDDTKNGLYFCTDLGGPGVVTTLETTWEKIGSGEGTLTGGTVVNNKISGATSSGYTQYWGEVVAITGGSYNDGTVTFSGSGPFSSTISGFNVLSGTGVDVSYINNSNNYGLKIDATNQQIERCHLQLNVIRSKRI
jgi:hypothetical protein